MNNNTTNARSLLVTGGAGFVGSHLVDSLIAEGRRVMVLDDLTTGNERNVNAKAEFYQMDVGSPEAARLISRTRPSAVLHLAAQTSVAVSVQEPLEDARTNIFGTLNLMEALRATGSGRFLFVSTGGAIYGETDGSPISEKADCHPWSPYGVSKLASEKYLQAFSAMHRFDYTIIRPGNIFGPRQSAGGGAGVVAIFARAMLKGEPVRIFGDGEDERDYVYVEDVVDCIKLALEKGGPTTYNVATGTARTVNTIFREMAAVTGYRLPPEHLPRRPGDLRRITLDPSKAASDLGWEPRTSFDEGLRRTIDYFRRE